MRELQGAGEGKHERDVIVRGEWYHSTVGVGDGAPGLGRKGGDAACQRRVVVDVEFEEVEERVRDGGDCAIYVCRRKVVSEVRRGAVKWYLSRLRRGARGVDRFRCRPEREHIGAGLGSR